MQERYYRVLLKINFHPSLLVSGLNIFPAPSQVQSLVSGLNTPPLHLKQVFTLMFEVKNPSWHSQFS